MVSQQMTIVKSRASIMGALALFLMTGVIIIFGTNVQRVSLGASNQTEYVKATVIEILEEYTSEEEGDIFNGNQLVKIQITSGKLKGSVSEASNTNSYLSGADCQVGTKIIARINTDHDNILSASVYNYDRDAGVWGLVILFLAVLCFIGGKKGIASALALAFSFVCIVFLYIPLMYIGVSPFLAAVIVSLLILVVSISLLNGFSRKSYSAMIGTMCGVIIAGVVAAVFGKISHITGFNIADAENLRYIGENSKLQISGVLFSGILIVSLGAVMDVSVSIAAAIYEIKETNPTFTRKQLFHSGMRVGKDMMGTMSNTLILAFAGSSVTTLIIVYAYQMPYHQVMSQYSIMIEVLRGLAGTLGVIMTVPIESAIASVLLKE